MAALLRDGVAAAVLVEGSTVACLAALAPARLPFTHPCGCPPAAAIGCRATPAFLDLFGQAAAEASQLEPSSGGSSADVAPGGDSIVGRIMGGSGSSSGGGALPAGAASLYEQRMWLKCLRCVGRQPASQQPAASSQQPGFLCLQCLSSCAAAAGAGAAPPTLSSPRQHCD